MDIQYVDDAKCSSSSIFVITLPPRIEIIYGIDLHNSYVSLSYTQNGEEKIPPPPPPICIPFLVYQARRRSSLGRVYFERSLVVFFCLFPELSAEDKMFVTILYTTQTVQNSCVLQLLLARHHNNVEHNLRFFLGGCRKNQKKPLFLVIHFEIMTQNRC